jgi:hypothetical protein
MNYVKRLVNGHDVCLFAKMNSNLRLTARRSVNNPFEDEVVTLVTLLSIKELSSGGKTSSFHRSLKHHEVNIALHFYRIDWNYLCWWSAL